MAAAVDVASAAVADVVVGKMTNRLCAVHQWLWQHLHPIPFESAYACVSVYVCLIPLLTISVIISLGSVDFEARADPNRLGPFPKVWHCPRAKNKMLFSSNCGKKKLRQVPRQVLCYQHRQLLLLPRRP